AVDPGDGRERTEEFDPVREADAERHRESRDVGEALVVVEVDAIRAERPVLRREDLGGRYEPEAGVAGGGRRRRTRLDRGGRLSTLGVRAAGLSEGGRRCADERRKGSRELFHVHRILSDPAVRSTVNAERTTSTILRQKVTDRSDFRTESVVG